MKNPIHREITPLQDNDCFLVFDRKRSAFTYPIHFHPEFEINFITDAKGGRRVVGDHFGIIGDNELVMVGPNLYHGWENYKNKNKKLHQVTLQFPRKLFAGQMINTNMLKPINELLKNSQRGILFSTKTTAELKPRFLALAQKKGFESYIEFQTILYEMAISEEQHFLTNISFQKNNDFYNSDKIEKIYNFIKENYSKKIKLEDAANMLNMSIVSFSRLIKQRTSKSFVDFVNEIRLGYATRMLIETNKSISEICYECGFNNISNFNRTFRKKQDCTPTAFRNNFIGIKNVY